MAERMTAEELAEIRQRNEAWWSEHVVSASDAHHIAGDRRKLLAELAAVRLERDQAMELNKYVIRPPGLVAELAAAQQRIADMTRADENGKPCDDCQCVHCPTTWAKQRIAELEAPSRQRRRANEGDD